MGGGWCRMRLPGRVFLGRVSDVPILGLYAPPLEGGSLECKKSTFHSGRAGPVPAGVRFLRAF
ncbi:hypothetical protein B484DRAFT_448667 [Ochromonadaceae sp. CCMP2298]|nr:hypothetical protein B484DRAFT_448667 [Ochromonadaceae sp. CCMP2298]